MSKFSGKCDLYDAICICGGFEKFKKAYPDLYLGSMKNKIEFTSLVDLVPYFPHITIVGHTNHEGGYKILSEKSWVDMEEKECGHMKMHDEYRRLLSEEKEKAATNPDYSIS